MSAAVPRRGASPVGVFSELSPLEQWAVRSLRQCCLGPEGQEALRSEAEGRLGSRSGDEASRAIERFMGCLFTHARRPLCHHSLTCPCVCGDEAAVALLFSLVRDSAPEDAAMVGVLLARPGAMPELLAAARDAIRAGAPVPRPRARPGQTAGHEAEVVPLNRGRLH